MISIPFSVPEFTQDITTNNVSLRIRVHKSNATVNLRSATSWDVQGLHLDVIITRPINVTFPLRNASIVASGNTVSLRSNNNDVATLTLGQSINVYINLLGGHNFTIPYSTIGDVISSSGLVWPVMEYLDSVADIDMIIDVMNRYSGIIGPIINNVWNDPSIRQVYSHILDNIQVMPTMAGRARCSCQG